MNRLTFGVSASPYLVTQVIHQAADNMRISILWQPPQQKLINYLSGTYNPEDALLLHKFQSNSPELLVHIPEELQEKSPDVNITQDPTVYRKTLGVHWNMQTDSFHVTTPNLTTCSTPLRCHGLVMPVTYRNCGNSNYLGIFPSLVINCLCVKPGQKTFQASCPRKLSQHSSPVVKRQIHFFTYGVVVVLSILDRGIRIPLFTLP